MFGKFWCGINVNETSLIVPERVKGMRGVFVEWVLVLKNGLYYKHPEKSRYELFSYT